VNFSVCAAAQNKLGVWGEACLQRLALRVQFYHVAKISNRTGKRQGPKNYIGKDPTLPSSSREPKKYIQKDPPPPHGDASLKANEKYLKEEFHDIACE
jgi:hypothetical protein